MSDPGHSINVIFAGQKYLVPLPLNSDATLLDLMKSIDSILHIPFDKQRIIYKGRSLTDPDALISSSGLTPGSRVMILGSVDKLNPDEAVKLVKAKDTSDAVDLQLKDLSNKLDTILSQSNSDSLEVTAHVKSTIDIMEQCMRTLELLDSVRLPYNCESERACRKRLVDTIQVGFKEFLVQADKLRAEFLKLIKT